MWVLDPPVWVPRENSFFRETLGESGRAGPRILCFLGIRQRFVARGQGPSDGVRPMGVVEGPCGYPAG